MEGGGGGERPWGKYGTQRVDSWDEDEASLGQKNCEGATAV